MEGISQQQQRASSQLPAAVTITWHPNPTQCMWLTVICRRGEQKQGEYVRAYIVDIQMTFRHFPANTI
jgi:hypothetical protein